VVARFDLEFRSNLPWSVQMALKMSKNPMDEEGFAPNPNRAKTVHREVAILFDQQNSKIQFAIPLHIVMPLYRNRKSGSTKGIVRISLYELPNYVFNSWEPRQGGSPSVSILIPMHVSRIGISIKCSRVMLSSLMQGSYVSGG
jgi:hypothetical protein